MRQINEIAPGPSPQGYLDPALCRVLDCGFSHYAELLLSSTKGLIGSFSIQNHSRPLAPPSVYWAFRQLSHDQWLTN